MDYLPTGLQRNAVAFAKGACVDLGMMTVKAVASYGPGTQAARWHPPGRGNNYFVNVKNQRLFIAGTIKAVPELRALRDIDVAVLPLYPPLGRKVRSM